MKIKQTIGILFSIFFILYGLSAEIFERVMFFNEILSLIGFLTFLFIFVKNTKIIVHRFIVFRLVIFFQVLCLIHLILSFLFKTNLYYYLRNSVIFYSSFSFFAAFYFYETFVFFLRKVKKLVVTYILFFLYQPSYLMLERFTTSFFFPIMFKKINFSTLLIIFALNVILAYQYSSLTITMVAGTISFFLLIRNYAWFKLIIISIILAFSLFFISMFSHLSLYKEGNYQLYGQGYGMNKVVESHLLLQLDYNTTWRLVFWYRVIVEKFPLNVWGIGFGTPLVEYIEGKDTAESPFDDEHDAHVSGCHNTFITLYARLGILFLLIIGLLYRAIIRDFYRNRRFYLANYEGLFFVAFFTISVIGGFNLLLETPTAASIFWILLGFVAKIIVNRKNTF